MRRSPIVRRQRLIDRLQEGLTRRLTLVSAGPGYGKTTLLIDFALSAEMPVCWYSLDERDVEKNVFLRYFLASGQGQFPAFGHQLASALERPEPPGPEETVDLMELAVSQVGEPFAFILDDFHFLDGAPPDLTWTIERWLARLPANCHVILAGRTRPRIGGLPLMMARQEVNMLSAPDFAFSPEEVALLFEEVFARRLSPDEANRLADLAEGWGGALVLLAGEAVSNSQPSPERLEISSALTAYIWGEQLDGLPEELKDFALASAVPQGLEAEFLGRLLAEDGAEGKLSELERLNLLSPQRAGRGYRYHGLLRSALLNQLRTCQPKRFRELQLKAASLREQSGEWAESVHHYLQAGEWESIVKVTERVGWQLFEEGKWDTLAEWLEAIPSDELKAQPKLVLWKVRILHYLNQLDKALALLAQVTSAFEAGQEWAPLAEALITKGMCLRMKGDYQESKDALSKARSLLLQHDGPNSVLTEARKELGITYGMCGEFEKALKELKGVLDVYEAQGDAYNIAHVNDQLGTCLLLLGRLSEAGASLEQARSRWLRLMNDQRLVQTLNNLGLAYYLEGDYERAEGVWNDAVEKVRRAGNQRIEVYLLAGLADIRRDSGQAEVAVESYRAALDLAIGLDDAFIRIYIMDAIANSYLLRGDVAASEPWAKRAFSEARANGSDFELGLCTITQGLIMRDRGQLKEAAGLLESAVQLLKRTKAKRQLATAYFHLAAVLFSLKRKRIALELMEISARLVVDLGYDHFLRVEAARNPLLVQYAAANKVSGGYWGQVLKISKGNATDGSDKREDMSVSGRPAVRAYALGDLRVEAGGREITDLEWRSEKSKEMFFFFLCNRRPLRKDEILAALWPDLPEDKSGSMFHSTLYRLRQALYPECIGKDSGRYVLDPQGAFLFDLLEFQEAAQQAEAAGQEASERLSLLERAIAMYGGAFAPGLYSEWAEGMRWRLEETHMRLLATQAEAYTQAGDFKRSAEACQRILDVDEYNEAAWYRLMASYVQSGQLEAARYCYKRYCQIVGDNLSGERPQEFEDIRREILSGLAK